MPDTNNTAPVVRLEKVDKHYRQGAEIVRAVDAVSLSIHAGDFVSITGRSGSGKTTLLSLIGKLTEPTSGQIQVFGHSLQEMDDAAISMLRSERIGFDFQFASLIPTLTVLDNIRLPGLFATNPVERSYALELLAWVGLSDKLGNYPAELSGGQQARIALARALANHPELLLADEPTGNLDVKTEWEVLSLLSDLNQQQNTTVILVTHNPELAQYGNRHLVMHGGQLIESYQQVPVEVSANG